MKKIIFVLFSISILFQLSCTDDNIPDDPIIDDPEIEKSIEVSINEDGGSIELEDLTLVIPEGAFDQSYEIKVSILSASNSGFDDVISQEYQVSGLPDAINNPIKLDLKHNSNASGDLTLVVGESTWVKSLDKEEISYQFIETNESGGLLSGEIPALIPEVEGGYKSNNFEQRGEEKLVLNILAIVGYSTVLSSDGHFRINAPSSLIDQTFDLAAYLEAAYSKFQQLGFDYGKRTKWPAEVNVKSLNTGVSGYSINSIWGNNYGYLEFNKSVLNSDFEMKVTAGHEFFHMVQSFYDPRNSFSKAKFRSPHIWVDEAMSVWSEGLFISDPNYVSPVFIQNADKVVKGAKLGLSDNGASYGYGMAAFIKFIVKRYGTDKLVKVYDGLLDGGSPAHAINLALPIPLWLLWDDFLEELFSFSIYKNENFVPSWLPSVTGSSGYFIINSKADSVKKFKLKYPDLSAHVFYLKNNNFKDFSDNAIVTFELDGNEDNQIQVYKFNANESVFMGQGQDTVILEDFKAILDDGYKVAAVVVNQKLDYPYNDEKELELKIKIEEKFEFDYLFVEIHGKANIEINKTHEVWGDTVYISEGAFFFNLSSAFDPSAQYQSHGISGNTVNTSANFQDQYGVNRSINMKTVFDNITHPQQVISFEYYESYSDSFNGGQTSGTKSIRIENVPNYYLSVWDNKPSYEFTSWGNESSFYDALYEETTTTSMGVTTKTLLEFSLSEGWVKLYFRQRP